MSNAFPVIYARDVKAAAGFYERLGLEQHYRFPPTSPSGTADERA